VTTVFGLPAHALLVHAIVVLAPLTALLGILSALLPAVRQRLVWLVVALAVVNLVLTPLTVSAGEWLYNREESHSPILERHEELGETMLWFSLALLVMAIALAVLHVRAGRAGGTPKALAIGVAVLAVVAGVASTVQVVRIGHAGTEAKWGVVDG
jgi:hypothetical protein